MKLLVFSEYGFSNLNLRFLREYLPDYSPVVPSFRAIKSDSRK